MDWMVWYCTCSLGYLAWTLHRMRRDHVFTFKLAELSALLADHAVPARTLKLAVALLAAADLLSCIAFWPYWLAVDLADVITRRRRRQ